MRTFKDSTDRNWSIDLTIGCLRRVKAQIQVDLIAPEAIVDENGKPAPEGLTLGQLLAADIMLAVDVIYACLKPQADAAGLAIDAFLEAFKPEVMAAARTAFMEEWEAFFLGLGRADQAAVVRAAIELDSETRTRQAEGTRQVQAAAMVALNRETQKVVDETIAELTSGSSSTSTPASLASTPSL